MQSANLLEGVRKVSLYLVLLLIPLWFLPLTQDPLVYQKQALLIVLVFLALLSWLGRAVQQGEVSFRVTWLYLPIALVVGAVGASTMFSLWRYGSFWGFPLNVADSFLTIAFFALLSVVIMNSVERVAQLAKPLFLLLVSGAVAGIFALLQAYGVFLVPAAFAKAATFNTVGAMNSVAILSAALLPLALALAVGAQSLKKWVLWGTVAAFFAVLAVINFFDAWVALAVGLLILLAFGMWNLKKQAQSGWVSVPMALIIVALFFTMFRFSLPGSPQMPVEVSPSMQGEWGIAKEVLKERAITGSGPGTFVFDYAKYRPESLNQTVFWGTRFSSGASEILGWLSQKGILGVLSLIFLIAASVFLGVKALLRSSQDSSSWMIGLGLLASFGATIAAFVLYPSTLVLSFVFWVLVGGLGVFVAENVKKVQVASQSVVALGSSFAFLLVLIFGLGLLFVGGQKYIAEAKYLQGVRASQQGNIQGAIEGVAGAATLNPSVDLYWRDLSQLYLSRLNEISQDASLSQDQKREQSQAVIQNAVNAVQKAAAAAPANIANWNVQGFVYRSLIGVPGADTLAFAAYEKAKELEPSSPFSWTELGRVYILQAQSLTSQKGKEVERETALAKALENLQRAIELKADYAPAHFLTAAVYEQQGKEDEAIAKLEETKQVAPNDTGLAFQLGTVYWQKKDLDKAQAELERAISLNANYSNARYILGLVFDAKKDKAKALEQFNKIAELNPDNEEVKKIIANIEAGKAPLDGIQVSQPPVPEAPPEIQKEEGR
ncbi:MAG: tetratricopeptide repeat protein [bacterium]|nr:tetratricopeptide repeat protein [bacterium]